MCRSIEQRSNGIVIHTDRRLGNAATSTEQTPPDPPRSTARRYAALTASKLSGAAVEHGLVAEGAQNAPAGGVRERRPDITGPHVLDRRSYDAVISDRGGDQLNRGRPNTTALNRCLREHRRCGTATSSRAAHERASFSTPDSTAHSELGAVRFGRRLLRAGSDRLATSRRRVAGCSTRCR